MTAPGPKPTPLEQAGSVREEHILVSTSVEEQPSYMDLAARVQQQECDLRDLGERLVAAARGSQRQPAPLLAPQRTAERKATAPPASTPQHPAWLQPALRTDSVASSARLAALRPSRVMPLP